MIYSANLTSQPCPNLTFIPTRASNSAESLIWCEIGTHRLIPCWNGIIYKSQPISPNKFRQSLTQIGIPNFGAPSMGKAYASAIPRHRNCGTSSWRGCSIYKRKESPNQLWKSDIAPIKGQRQGPRRNSYQPEKMPTVRSHLPLSHQPTHGYTSTTLQNENIGRASSDKRKSL